MRTDPERARDLLLEFADFPRYALRRGGAFTTLAEELRNVERYLVLEQARFGDRMRVSLMIAPEVLPVTVPYLAIQPIVENAVRHGIAGKEGGGQVNIVATDKGSEAEISIEDDGIGSDPEEIRRVLDGQADPESVGLGTRRRPPPPGLRGRLRAGRGDGNWRRHQGDLPRAQVRARRAPPPRLAEPTAPACRGPPRRRLTPWRALGRVCRVTAAPIPAPAPARAAPVCASSSWTTSRQRSRST